MRQQTKPHPVRDRQPKGLEFDRHGLVSSKSGTYLFGFGIDAVPVFVHQRQSQDGLDWKVARARAQRGARREKAS